MAQETWAGGTIIGAQPDQGTRKGAYIPLSDIPNVPKTVQMPMITDYPKGPTARYDYLPGQIDMSRRAAALQQAPLPSSFEEAGNIRTAYAGQAAEAQANAITSVGKGITAVADAAAKIYSESSRIQVEHKDNADKDRYAIAESLASQRLQDMYKTVPMDQWDAKSAEINNNFRESVKDLGVRDFTKQTIQTAANAWTTSRLTYGLPTQKNIKSIAMDHDLATGEINDGIAQKDWGKAARGADLLRKNDEINDDQHKELLSKINFAHGMDIIETAKQDPGTARGLLEDAERVQKGGKAENFDILNSNPGIVPNLLVDVREAVKVHDRNGVNAIKEGFSNGSVKSEADIERIGGEYKLPKEYVDTLKKSWKSEAAPYVPGNHVVLRDRINNFEPNTDTDGRQEFALRNSVENMIDKDSRSKFISLIDEKIKNKDKPKAAVEIDHKDTLNKIAERDKQGLLVPEGMQSDLAAWRVRNKALNDAIDEASKRLVGGEKLAQRIAEIKKQPQFQFTGAEEKAYHANSEAVNDHILKADQFKEKNPDAKPGEMQKEILGENSAVQKQTEQNAARATAVPLSQTSGVTRQRFAAADLPAKPSTEGWGPPRATQQASPDWTAALSSPGEHLTMTATAYNPGSKTAPGMEGPNKLPDGSTPKTFEQYLRGHVPHVSVAMDSASPLQGKYLINESNKNVVFKVEDTGDAFIGKGNTRIDIAFSDPQKAKDFKMTGGWKVVSEEEARKIAGGIGGSTTSLGPVPQGTVVASIERKTSGPTGAPMTSGTLNVGGIPFRYNSGGYGRGNLPAGEYVVTEHMPHRNTPGMVVGTVGFSFALSDKFDQRVGGTRTLLRIHPDGGTSGTAGCIGIVGGKDDQLRFRDAMTAEIRRNGGKAILRVG